MNRKERRTIEKGAAPNGQLLAISHISIDLMYWGFFAPVAFFVSIKDKLTALRLSRQPNLHTRRLWCKIKQTRIQRLSSQTLASRESRTDAVHPTPFFQRGGVGVHFSNGCVEHTLGLDCGVRRWPSSSASPESYSTIGES